jgi:hypothetical protein
MNKSPIQLPQTLVNLCLKFYHADSYYTAKTANILRIMESARNTLKHTSASISDPERLILEVSGRISKDMQRVRAGANGKWVISDLDAEQIAIHRFARYYVEQLFIGEFRGDKAKLSSERGIGIIEDTFEMLARLEMRRLGESKKTGSKQEQPQLDAGAFDWKIERTDENEIVILGAANLEICITDFDPSLAQHNKLDLDFESMSVKYPLEVPTDYSDDFVWLEVCSITNYEVYKGTLHFGSKVSLPIPYEFAKELQATLSNSLPAIYTCA